MVANTQPADPHLASFPRPQGDNGRGLHFILDSRQNAVEQYAPYLDRMHIKWATVYGLDDQQVTRLAGYLLSKYGIFSNLRVQANGSAPKPPSFWQSLAQLCVQNNIPPYIQIFNEPEQGREGFLNPQQFADLWGARAEAVVAGGGFPGLQVLSEDYLATVAAGVSDTVKNKMYFCLHNYGSNHPPSYPYPDRTVLDDGRTVLQFLAFGAWFQKYLSFVPPMVGGEGGWHYQDAEDASMPLVGIDLWADWHHQMYDWFRTGTLSNGDPLPDYLFSVCPWLLYAANWLADSWVDGLDSNLKSALVDRLASDPPYTRVFSGQVQPSPLPPPPPPPPLSNPPPPPPPPPEAVPSPTGVLVDPRVKWLTINQGTQYKVTEVWFYDAKPPDDPESEGNINIYTLVRDTSGRTLQHEAVAQVWPDGSTTKYTRNGITVHQMSGDSNFDPKQGQAGPYIMQIGDASVSGLGLPLRQHVEYLIVVEKAPSPILTL